MTEDRAPYNVSSKFVQAVSDRLLHRNFANDPTWLVQRQVAEILAMAAVEIIGEGPFAIRLRREVSTEKPRQVFTIIEDGDEGVLFLSSEEVKELRALLLNWDEDELLPGTPYTHSIRLRKSGFAAPAWQPWHDEVREDED